MISQQYLDLLDNLSTDEYSNCTVEEILEDINTIWLTMQKEYPDWIPFVKIDLDYLSSASYVLLARLTNTNIEDVTLAAKELHRVKNAGYSGDNPDPWHNFRECEKFGISAIDGCITRLCDKWRRFNNVYNNATLDQVNESAIDTLKDLAAYSLIAYCLLTELE